MQKFQVKVLDKGKETIDVITLKLEKPAGFEFSPGQHISLRLSRELTHIFSIASSPTESFIMIATKNTGSDYKKALEMLGIGSMVDIIGPAGEFVLEDKPLNILLSGGIGITPFRSIIKYATDKALKNRIILLFSNKTAEDIPFRKELEEWSKQNENFKLVLTVTKLEESKQPWQGKTGRIDANMIKQFSSPEAVYYICGPPAMVDGLINLLKELGIGETSIRVERFEGY